MALLVISSAGTGEVLAEFDEDEFQKMVETHDNTVKTLKLHLKDKGFGSRFQQRILNDVTEMQDDEILVPPIDLKLVKMTLLSSDETENEKFVQACSTGNLEEVEFRLKKLQDPNAAIMTESAQERTALHFTAEYGQVEVARLLLEAGASCDVGKTSGTPLHRAAERGDLDMTRLLLDAKALCDAKTHKGGDTPLHCAAACGHLEVVRLLLEARANCDQTNKHGKSSLQLAAMYRNNVIVRLLEKSRST